MTYPTITVEAAFTVGGAFGTALILDDASLGLLDTGTLSAEVWSDITPYVLGFNTRRGASRADGPILRFEAGQATLTLDNSDRRFDPTNLSGPYVAGGLTQVTPMRKVRISAVHDGTSYPVFTGFADAWDITYQGYGSSTCVLTATDATKVLSNQDRVALGAAVGASELSGARVSRVLDSMGWSTLDRDIDEGESTLQETTMDRSVWEELLQVQDSEIGQVFVEADGVVTFHGRHYLLENPTSTTSQLTLGDGAGETPFVEAPISYDDTTLNNLVRIARTGGTQQTAEDITSQQDYLIHTYDRTDLIVEADTDAADYAAFILYQTKDPELRFTSVTVNGNDDQDVLFPHMLGRRFGDLITITRDPPGGGAITRTAYIVGVSHEVPGVNEWRTTWQLQSAAKWSFMILDHTTLGVLDANALAY
jgi:hypothetical protein